jgi:hypothetical protein
MKLRAVVAQLSLLLALFPAAVLAQDWKKDWERTLQEAKKEGKIVVAFRRARS